MNGPARPPEGTRGLPGALPACSAGLVALAVVLWRALPALIGQPLAPLVLLPALMSTAAGGLVPCLAPRRFPAEAVRRQLGRLSLALALALCAQPAFFFTLARVAPLADWFLAQTPQPRPVALAALWVVFAAPFFLGGVLAGLALAERGADAGRAWAGVLAGGAIGALVALLVVVPAVAASGGAVEIPYAGGRREPAALLARWGVSSRVLVRALRGDEAATALALGRLYRGPLPDQLGLVVDDATYADVVRHRPGDEPGWAPATLTALAQAIRRDPRVLIVGAGGGSDVLVARALGDGPIRAVESDALVVRVVEEDLAGFSGRPFSLAGVEAVVADGRAFLRRDLSAYDLIVAPGAPGLPRLLPAGRDHLATREAFGELLARLAPDGLLSRRFSGGERPLLRFVATARAALEDAGAEAPWAHLFIAAAGDVANVIVKRSPFAVGEVAALEARCRGLGFDVVYSPAREGAGAIARFVRAEDPGAFLAGLPFDATPVVDDRPFLLRQLRPRDLFLGGARGAGIPDRALVAVRNLLCIALVPALAAALVPLRRREPSNGETRGSRLAAAVHFGAIGLGTVMAGVGLLAHVQVVDSPASAVAPLAVFLAAGAIGSARAERAFAAAAAQRRRCGVLAVVLMLAAALLPALAGVIGGAPLWSRLVVAGAAAGFVGYLLGRPFPAALPLLGERLLVAWGWAVWSAFSVLGLAAALLVAATSGFATTLLAGAACFLVAGALAEVCG